MARKNEPVAKEELHEFAQRAEEFGLDADSIANRMDKALTREVGDDLELLSKLAMAAENILLLHRKVMGAARMIRSNQELESRLRARAVQSK